MMRARVPNLTALTNTRGAKIRSHETAVLCATKVDRVQCSARVNFVLGEKLTVIII